MTTERYYLDQMAYKILKLLPWCAANVTMAQTTHRTNRALKNFKWCKLKPEQSILFKISNSIYDQYGERFLWCTRQTVQRDTRCTKLLSNGHECTSKREWICVTSVSAQICIHVERLQSTCLYRIGLKKPF